MTAEVTIPTQTVLVPASGATVADSVAQAPAVGQVSRADFTSLSDRMSYLLVLRLAMGAIVAIWAILRPEALVVPLQSLAALTVVYLLISVAGEWARRRSVRFEYWIITALLVLDGLYLACAMYATGGTHSPIRFVVYLHIVSFLLLETKKNSLKLQR